MKAYHGVPTTLVQLKMPEARRWPTQSEDIFLAAVKLTLLARHVQGKSIEECATKSVDALLSGNLPLEQHNAEEMGKALYREFQKRFGS